MNDFRPIETVEEPNKEGEWRLALQWGQYPDKLYGYRFVWLDQEDKTQHYLLQTRIPSLEDIAKLLELAMQKGGDWGKKKNKEE